MPAEDDPRITSGGIQFLREISFSVDGAPAPQGSKSLAWKNGRTVMYESSKKVGPWRRRVKASAIEAAKSEDWARHRGPIMVKIVFRMPAPQSPKWKAAGRPDVMPDIDKLVRSTFDAVDDSNMIFFDDGQVVELEASKVYGRPTGADITITAFDESERPIRRKSK